jgi:hypothetical protein
MVSPFVRSSLLALLLVAGIAIAGVAYLRLAAVPIRTLDEQWYRYPPSLQCTEVFDAKVQRDHRWAILRAEADHFVAPAYQYGRRLGFLAVCRDAEDPLYFEFWADMHKTVVYCWSQKQGKFLWKAVEDHSA